MRLKAWIGHIVVEGGLALVALALALIVGQMVIIKAPNQVAARFGMPAVAFAWNGWLERAGRLLLWPLNVVTGQAEPTVGGAALLAVVLVGALLVGVGAVNLWLARSPDE